MQPASGATLRWSRLDPLLSADSDDDLYHGFRVDPDGRGQLQYGMGIAYAPLGWAMRGGLLARKKSDEAAVY